MTLEALTLRSHLAIPKLDVSHRVSRHYRAIFEYSKGPHNRMFSFELIDCETV